ncbi:glycosyl transferase family 4 [Oleiagrimonas sp. MCCC 1A03011]|uniref:glycosyl transferase family 4 n=1 Tax=Oleiagrimonas sp. MCCC 1A03011 TaxID=1926883 RepID=UPI000DC34469|nr:glycosyl transferase family 4 [Oleiagrimonas sp. MCCC 1A03011]RAP57926.1 hypothetical protein BTJ49_08710 [Oleiagrimonas sp. MCCC 1A03011]
MNLHLLVLATVSVLVSMLVAVLVTGFMVDYARRRGMLDHPGQRRSHTLPTPRGGGLGLILGALLGMAPVLWFTLPSMLGAAFLLAALLVACVGWLDDHRNLPALPRLVVHLLAAALFCAYLVVSAGWSFWWLPPMVLVAAWSVNLHNFMDGSDGMLGMQLVFVGWFSAVLCAWQGLPHLAMLNLALSAAATGFLVYNLPPARIFMGDVGSGGAGLLVFMLAALWCREDIAALWTVLILHAVFMVDAGMTLAGRMLRGRRWYTAHCEHLYQWLVRSGFSHGRTGWLYLIYNLAIIAPLAWLSARDPRFAFWICVIAYAVTMLIWWLARRHCLQRVSRRGGHAHA